MNLPLPRATFVSLDGDVFARLVGSEVNYSGHRTLLFEVGEEFLAKALLEDWSAPCQFRFEGPDRDRKELVIREFRDAVIRNGLIVEDADREVEDTEAYGEKVT